MPPEALPAEPLKIHVTAAAQEVLALRAACTHLLNRLQTWQNARPEMDTRTERELLLTVLGLPIVYPCDSCGKDNCTPNDYDAWSGTYSCPSCRGL